MMLYLGFTDFFHIPNLPIKKTHVTSKMSNTVHRLCCQPKYQKIQKNIFHLNKIPNPPPHITASQQSREPLEAFFDGKGYHGMGRDVKTA